MGNIFTWRIVNDANITSTSTALIGAGTEKGRKMEEQKRPVHGVRYPRRNWEGQKLFEQLKPIVKYRKEMSKIQRVLAYTGVADPLYKVTIDDQEETADKLSWHMNYYHDCICANDKYKILKPRELRMFKLRYYFGMSIPQIAERMNIGDQRTIKRQINDDIVTRLAVVMYKEGWMPWAGEKPKNEP